MYLIYGVLAYITFIYLRTSSTAGYISPGQCKTFVKIKLQSPPFSFILPLFLVWEVKVLSQHQRIKCHPQGLNSSVDVCQNHGARTWLLQFKDSCLLAHAASLLTTVTLAAALPAWDGKRIPDPSAKDNRKYDMGTSQLSGSPTLNTTT